MNCFKCKGKLENKTTTFMMELENKCIIIIKNVPSQVCTQCGDISYSTEVSEKIEKIINSIKYAMTEIMVMDYSKKIA